MSEIRINNNRVDHSELSTSDITTRTERTRIENDINYKYNTKKLNRTTLSANDKVNDTPNHKNSELTNNSSSKVVEPRMKVSNTIGLNSLSINPTNTTHIVDDRKERIIEDRKQYLLNIMKIKNHKKQVIRDFIKCKPVVPYIYKSDGPILITAPHTMPVDRRYQNGSYKTLHKREKYAAELTVKVAVALKKYLGRNASFIIWDPRAK